jgi:hypothetical protein
VEALKAAGRANGALREPSSPAEEALTATTDCDDSEATESEPEQPELGTGHVSEPIHGTDPSDAENNEGPPIAPAPKPQAKLQMPECPPKTFNRAKHISKGTLQFFSPCGAKIGTFEMIKSESMTLLFSTLSRIMPILAPVLKDLREQRGMNERNVKVLNAATKKMGTVSRSLMHQ